ncbi:hypothetical protein AMTR_s00068p00152090 [Amborella trichopoda]|uniref:Uncharacterized protein n=1 Tax=Amborella trichopoda TaxID=13333 RepID=U5DG72_AMBTC|nr:hypothetical protein AMTR_s00068p00152090 [Amborella trichopoda]
MKECTREGLYVYGIPTQSSQMKPSNTIFPRQTWLGRNRLILFTDFLTLNMLMDLLRTIVKDTVNEDDVVLDNVSDAGSNGDMHRFSNGGSVARTI